MTASDDELDPPDKAVVAKEMERAVELFVSGKSYRFIADDLGRGLGTAHRRVQAGLHEARRLKAEEYITAELLMFQDLQDRLVQRLAAGVPPERVAKLLLELSDRRRRLMGLDAPTRSRVEVDAGPGAHVEVGFARVVEEAERAAQADEEEIRGAG